MRDELKPCPFCGSEAHMMHNPRGPFGRGWVSGAWKAGCSAVCIVSPLWWQTEAEAAAAWNRRAAQARIAELEAELAASIREIIAYRNGLNLRTDVEEARLAELEATP